MKINRFLCLCTLFWLVGCSAISSGNGSTGKEITVFAASSLTNAFDELAEVFESQNPDVQVVLHFAGSSQLAAQLREGIEADLFASANPAQMAAVVQAGRVEAGAEVAFVSNRLAIIVPVDNPAQLEALADIATPAVQLILAARGVPIRDYTDRFVANMTTDFQSQFYKNVVSEEDNVRRVAAKIALGEADVGIVYQSDITLDIAEQVQQIVIPKAQNVVATYPIAPLIDAPQPELAQQFIDFVRSPAGQDILSRWGFGPPSGN